jgi:putative aldouronate transport system substrate-binding protein
MKKRRTLLPLLVSLALVFFSACTGAPGGNATHPAGSQPPAAATATPADSGPVNKTGMPIANEKLTFTAMANRGGDDADWNSMWCFKKFAEITNIAFDIQCVDSNVWTEKVNLAFATQTLPDVFFGGIPEFDLANYGKQGLIISLQPYLEDYAPLIRQYFEKYPDIKKAMMSPDGNIYEFYGFNLSQRELASRRFWINTKWIQDLGMKVPTNLDEFYNVLLAFKQNDCNGNGKNDEIPIGGRYGTGTSDKPYYSSDPYFSLDIPILVAFGYVDSRIDTVNGQVVYVPTEARYKDYLQYTNKLFKEGLIDSEYFSQTEDQYKAKGAEMRYGCFSYYADWLLMGNEDQYSQYASIPPMTSQYNSVQMWPADATFSKTGIMNVTKPCKYPEAIVRFMDWLYTEEGSIIAQLGPQNGTYEGGAGGWELVDNGQGQQAYKLTWPEKYSSYNEFRKQELNPMTLPYVSIPGTQPIADRLRMLDAKQIKLTGDIEKNFSPYYKLPFPIVPKTADESDQINTICTDLTPYVQQMEARFISGEESFDNFGAFVQGCKDRGSEKLVQIYQLVYDRWNAGK